MLHFSLTIYLLLLQEIKDVHVYGSVYIKCFYLMFMEPGLRSVARWSPTRKPVYLFWYRKWLISSTVFIDAAIYCLFSYYLQQRIKRLSLQNDWLSRESLSDKNRLANGRATTLVHSSDFRQNQ